MTQEDTLMKALQEASPRLAQATIPFWGFFEAGPDLIGSGTLIRIGDKSFVLTAAHVVDEIRTTPTHLSTGSPDGDHFPLGQISVATSSAGKEADRSDDPFDIAAIELRDDTVARLTTCLRFLSLIDVEAHDDRLPSAHYALVGYPHANPTDTPESCSPMHPPGTVRDYKNRLLCSTVMPFYTTLYEGDRGALQFDFKKDIVLNFHPAELIRGRRFGFPLPSAKGLSGSGIWRVFPTGPSLEDVDWRRMRIVGVVHEHEPSTQTLKGTRIKYALQLIYNHWPELRAEIDRYFPYPSLA
jgi:hypothetical protein